MHNFKYLYMYTYVFIVCLVAHMSVSKWSLDVKVRYQSQVSTSRTVYPLLLRQDLSLARSRPCRLGWLASKLRASTQLHSSTPRL